MNRRKVPERLAEKIGSSNLYWQADLLTVNSPEKHLPYSNVNSFVVYKGSLIQSV